MNFKPLVSIIINNYNYASYLAEAIDSALAQTYSNVEVIVVDDASTDSSKEIIDDYQARITKVLRQHNGKQAAALNDGFLASKGEIIIFLDADDYLLADAIEEIVDIWQENLAKVHYRLSVIDAKSQPLGFSYPQGDNPLSSGKILEKLLLEGRYTSVPMSGNAISRNALTQIFPIPEEYKLTADNYLSILIPFYGEVAAIEKPLGVYRVHGANQWALDTTEKIDDRKIRRFIEHDRVSHNLLVSKAKELNYRVSNRLNFSSPDRFWVRLISLKIAPKLHPVVSDSKLKLILLGTYSILTYAKFGWLKKLAYLVWLNSIALAPKKITNKLITWFYAPKTRPNFISLLSLKK